MMYVAKASTIANVKRIKRIVVGRNVIMPSLAYVAEKEGQHVNTSRAYVLEILSRRARGE